MLIDSESFGWTTNAADLLTYGAFAAMTPGASIATGGPLGDNYLVQYISRFDAGAPNRRQLAAPTPRFFFGARVDNKGSAAGFGAWFDDVGSNNQVWVQVDGTNGVVTARRGGTLPHGSAANGAGAGGGTVLGASAPGAAPLTGWHYLEVAGVIDAAAGSVIVRVNGAAVLTLAGINTLGNASGTVGRYGVEPLPEATLATAHWYFCDTQGPGPDNTFLGDVRVQAMLPVANDAVGFAPSGQPANWQNAALVPPNPASDYNAATAAATQDTFSCNAAGAGLGLVFGVHTKALLAKSDSGPRTMALVLKSGAGVAVGPEVAVGTSPQQARMVSRLDPDTGRAWTLAAVNLAKPGYRIVA